MLLIFDEVQCGLGTTGRNWCCEHFGVMPDLMAFGKKAQVCGVMAGPRLDEVKDNAFRLPSRLEFDLGRKFYRHGALDAFPAHHREGEPGRERARDGRTHFLKSLHNCIAAEFPIMTAVRGRGLFIAFDLPDPKTRDEFWKGLFDRGVLALKSGEQRDSFPSRARHHRGSRRRSDGSAAQAMSAHAALDLVAAVDGPSRRRYIWKAFSTGSVSPKKMTAYFSANGAAAARRSTRFRRSTARNWPAFAPLRRRITTRRSLARTKHF